jgi:cytoskeletal protein CcmA (bactofilin family)
MATYPIIQDTTTNNNNLVARTEPSRANDKSTNIHIGEGVSITGSITLSGHATVNGTVDGELRAGSLEIGRTGQVTGKIFANSISVSGILKDEIHCREHFQINASGQVTGNLEYSEIEIERGGKFIGDMKEIKK